MARLLIRKQRFSEAEKLLREAEAVLLERRDWEDLPGVQIELHLLGNLKGDKRGLHTIGELARKAVSDGALIVQLCGANAIAEILLRQPLDDSEYRTDLLSALGRADEAGVIETSWWLSYSLGEIAARQGNQREAQARFRRAVQGLNQIADGLTIDHRKLYLNRPHTRSALNRISSVGA